MTACNSIKCFGWGIASALVFSTVGARETLPASSPDRSVLKLDGAIIDVTFDSAPTAALRQLLVAWITKAAKAVDIYYA